MGEGRGTALIVISLAPVLTILARVLAINLYKAMTLPVKLCSILRDSFNDALLKPGSLPGPINHKIDGVGDEIPDAKEKAQQTSHKPHAENPKHDFFRLIYRMELYLSSAPPQMREWKTPGIILKDDKPV